MTGSGVPRVSFLLPVYNDAPFLRATLASLLSQTLSDFEIIAVDDGSSDETPQILQSTGDPRLRYVRNETNLGLVASLNRGLDLCRGEFVARIDGDDICEPERLAEQVKHLESHPQLAGCATWTTEIDEHDSVIRSLEPHGDPDHVRWTMCHTLRLYHPTMMLRRQAYVESRGYSPDYPATEDYELWTRLVSGGKRLGIVCKRLVRYRRRPGSITANSAERQNHIGRQIATRYISQMLGRPVSEQTVGMMRSLLGWDLLEPAGLTPATIRPALKLMAGVRQAALAHADPAARAAADTEVAQLLQHHGRWFLKASPAVSAPLGLYLTRLPGHRRTGANLITVTARCVAGTFRRSVTTRCKLAPSNASNSTGST